MSGRKDPYEGLYGLPHHVSPVHPPMPLSDRAAQFSPFAALTGFGAVITETARPTRERVELDENRKAELDRTLRELAGRAGEGVRVSVRYFRPDGRKSGGAIVTASGPVKKLDEFNRRLLLADGRAIPVDELLDLSLEAPSPQEDSK